MVYSFPGADKSRTFVLRLAQQQVNYIFSYTLVALARFSHHLQQNRSHANHNINFQQVAQLNDRCT